MTTKTDGGPAFPILNNKIGYHADIRQEWYGVTVRDYFAAKAMQAAATNPAGADGFTFQERARWAYEQADAMLAARENT